MNVGAVGGPVIFRKCPLQELRLLNAMAGAPAAIPSKSSGNACADLRP